MVDVVTPLRSCVTCGRALTKKPGPGRWPRYCSPACKRGRPEQTPPQVIEPPPTLWAGVVECAAAAQSDPVRWALEQLALMVMTDRRRRHQRAELCANYPRCRARRWRDLPYCWSCRQIGA